RSGRRARPGRGRRVSGAGGRAPHARAVAGTSARRARGAMGLIVKICGITRAQDAALAVAAGADWLGLNFWPASKRAVDAARGRAVIKAISLASAADVTRIARYPVDTVLVDTPTAGYGGSGRTFDWSLAREAVATGKRIILAGGLHPGNVAAAVAEVKPFGV